MLIIAPYLKNCVHYLFLSSACYAEHRCFNFSRIMISQISVHKCVIHPGKETLAFPDLMLLDAMENKTYLQRLILTANWGASCGRFTVL